LIDRGQIFNGALRQGRGGVLRIGRERKKR